MLGLPVSTVGQIVSNGHAKVCGVASTLVLPRIRSGANLEVRCVPRSASPLGNRVYCCACSLYSCTAYTLRLSWASLAWRGGWARLLLGASARTRVRQLFAGWSALFLGHFCFDVFGGFTRTGAKYFLFLHLISIMIYVWSIFLPEIFFCVRDFGRELSRFEVLTCVVALLKGRWSEKSIQLCYDKLHFCWREKKKKEKNRPVLFFRRLMKLVLTSLSMFLQHLIMMW